MTPSLWRLVIITLTLLTSPSHSTLLLPHLVPRLTAQRQPLSHTSNDNQLPLREDFSSPAEEFQYHSKDKLKTEQNSSVCDAGSRHWTGHIPVGGGKGRDMFYWYFESLVKPEEAPLVIWINGGPGGSSMLGAFHEIGPCRLSQDGKTTSRNEYSWTRHANMLFIDQPIGVGLSTPLSSSPSDTSLWTITLRQGGTDLSVFLDVFITDLYPELEGRELHFAGESFGGKYVPFYVSMLRRRFESVILVDPSIDPALNRLGQYRHFCPALSTSTEEQVQREVDERGQLEKGREKGKKGKMERYLNATACSAMEAAYPKCERARRACTDTYEEYVCARADRECQEVNKWWEDEVGGPGGRDPYDDRTACEPGIDLCHDMGQDRTTTFFNLPHIKSALGLPPKFKYESISYLFNEEWKDNLIPTTREITSLLDNRQTRVLVVNGNNDGIIVSESVKTTFDELSWHGQARYSRMEYKGWRHESGDGKVATGEVKRCGNLTVVTVDQAGHMSPRDQEAAGVRLLGMWLGVEEWEW